MNNQDIQLIQEVKNYIVEHGHGKPFLSRNTHVVQQAFYQGWHDAERGRDFNPLPFPSKHHKAYQMGFDLAME